MKTVRKLAGLLLFFLPFAGKAQLTDSVYMPGIRGVKLFVSGDQMTYPILSLGSLNSLELHFDDAGNYVKNFNYTYQLCNADWKPVTLGSMDFIQGFTQNRVSEYRLSSIAKLPYVHYTVRLPERSCAPTKSGNYILKVFLNGDTTKLAFTKRLLIFETLTAVSPQIVQPYNSELFQTHQKIQFFVDKSRLNLINPLEQLKVVVMQNYRWDNASYMSQPTFMRNNLFEYSNETNCVFPAGKEFRWVDLRSFRFQSERINSVDKNATPFSVVLKPDGDRAQSRFLTYRDLNGFWEISTTDLINPWWQGDYGNVRFIYRPTSGQPYPGKDVYIIGQFTDYKLNDSTKMTFNSADGVYEKTMLLKQGYYTYTYATANTADKNKVADVSLTDGNYWETENDYTVLVYFRDLSGRHDRLICVSTINSKATRAGF